MFGPALDWAAVLNAPINVFVLCGTTLIFTPGCSFWYWLTMPLIHLSMPGMSLSPQNQYVRLALYGLDDVAADPPAGALLELHAETSANAAAMIAVRVALRRACRCVPRDLLRLLPMDALLSHPMRYLLTS
jgi:hypothetical protein